MKQLYLFAFSNLLTWLILNTIRCRGLSFQASISNPPLFSEIEPENQRCATLTPALLEGLNITESERALLPFICLPLEDEPDQQGQRTPPLLNRDSYSAPTTTTLHQSVPPGIDCVLKQWCDGSICSTVCARGTVVVDPWISAATRLQARLVHSLPFCYAWLMGTHNSAITIADGYGNLDAHFQSWFKYIRWASEDVKHSRLRTNNQYLSLTDQLNLGVRSIELDTHWVGGELRIAHCGGFHVGPLNKLISALNLVAKLLHQDIRWDTETMGCNPSLSSIPAMEQRPLDEALVEIKDWMDLAENGEEFLIVYFDDQPDLGKWGVAAHLQASIDRIYSRDRIFTTDDLEEYRKRSNNNSNNGGWPTIRQMVKAGKKMLFVSGADYGEEMKPLIFPRKGGDLLCNWSEAPLSSVAGVPECIVDDSSSSSGRNEGSGGRGGKQDLSSSSSPSAMTPPPTNDMFDGNLLRVATCELEYGPLNCDFVWKGSNYPYFDETTLPPVLGCGLNLPAVDLLTPTRAAAAVWTWAPGHPYTTTTTTSQAAAAGGDASCAVVLVSDGRWRAVTCPGDGSGGGQPPVYPSACRQRNTSTSSSDNSNSSKYPFHSLSSSNNNNNDDNDNDAGVLGTRWILGDKGRGWCPEGSYFDVPRHPRENYQLKQLLKKSGQQGAWLPLNAPTWLPPDMMIDGGMGRGGEGDVKFSRAAVFF